MINRLEVTASLEFDVALYGKEVGQLLLRHQSPKARVTQFSHRSPGCTALADSMVYTTSAWARRAACGAPMTAVAECWPPGWKRDRC